MARTPMLFVPVLLALVCTVAACPEIQGQAQGAPMERMSARVGEFARLSEDSFGIVGFDLAALRKLPRGSENVAALVELLTCLNGEAHEKYHEHVKRVIDIERVSLILHDQCRDWPAAGEWVLFGDLDSDKVAADFLTAGLREYKRDDLPAGVWKPGARYLGEAISENSLKVVVTKDFTVLGNDAFTWCQAHRERRMASRDAACQKLLEKAKEGAVIAGFFRYPGEERGSRVEIALRLDYETGRFRLHADARIPPEALDSEARFWLPNLRGKVSFEVGGTQLFDWLPFRVDVRGTVAMQSGQSRGMAIDATIGLTDAEDLSNVLRLLKALIAANAHSIRISEKDVGFLRAFLRVPGLRDDALRRLEQRNDPETAKELIRQLKDPDPPVRRWAATALGRLQAKDAIPDLEQLSQDPSESVQRAAREALEAIKRGN